MKIISAKLLGSKLESEKGIQVSPKASRAAQLEELAAECMSNETVKIKFKKKEVWRIRTDREYRLGFQNRLSVSVINRIV